MALLRFFVPGVFLALLISVAPLSAQNESDSETYVPPAGGPPPVAPPLKKGSPLDHLANDPKQETPTPGYKEGDTKGDDYWIGHRFIDTQGGEGWGWIKKNGAGWGSAKWIALQETLGLAVAPHRKLLKADADTDWEYKFWGHFAPYKAYDPHLDEQLPVFVLQGYEVIGLAYPLNNKVGPPDRIQHRASGASSRNNRPILSDPGVD
ncbi:MAG: hypothetical protein LV479_08800 [Methylacidiphilales bacterium]|nr:hypothetical protein [Candidatus Methylacidiphilales bacterium]